MKIHVDTGSFRDTRFSEYAVRFFFGGAVTVLAGLIAQKFGAAVGGLFLAFPAIFPAGATLMEKHQREKKLRAGLNPGTRGCDAVSLDAAGATMGSIGLLVFAVLIWQFLPRHSAAFILPAGTLAWLVVSVGAWQLCEYL
jgi:hypothetical protein